MTCLNFKELTRYMADDLPPERAAAFEQHVAICPRCAGLREELAVMAARIAPDPGEFDDPALADEVMTLIKLGRAQPRGTPDVGRTGRWRWALVPAAAAALAVALVVLVPAIRQTGMPPEVHAPGTAPAGGESGFQARGGGDEQPDRWVSLSIYRAGGDGYEPVGESLAANDDLAFAYEDRSPKPYGYLMILAVDGRGKIFWYYPAHLREGENPHSVRTTGRPGQVELPEAVRHDLVPGKLRIFALFARRALDVGTVEALVSRQLGEAEGNLDHLVRLPVADTGQHSLLLRVEEPVEARGE